MQLKQTEKIHVYDYIQKKRKFLLPFFTSLHKEFGSLWTDSNGLRTDLMVLFKVFFLNERHWIHPSVQKKRKILWISTIFLWNFTKTTKWLWGELPALEGGVASECRVGDRPCRTKHVNVFSRFKCFQDACPVFWACLHQAFTNLKWQQGLSWSSNWYSCKVYLIYLLTISTLNSYETSGYVALINSFLCLHITKKDNKCHVVKVPCCCFWILLNS